MQQRCLLDHAADEEDGARAHAPALLERERGDCSYCPLRRGELAALREAEPVPTPHHEMIGAQAARQGEGRVLVHLGRHRADEESQEVQRTRRQVVPSLLCLRLLRQATRVLWEHAEVGGALAQVGFIALEALVQRTGHARVALRHSRLLACHRAVDADAADAAAIVRRLKAVLARRHAVCRARTKCFCFRGGSCKLRLLHFARKTQTCVKLCTRVEPKRKLRQSLRPDGAFVACRAQAFRGGGGGSGRVRA